MRTPQFPNDSPSLACRTLLKTAEQFEELFALRKATDFNLEQTEETEEKADQPQQEDVENEALEQAMTLEKQCEQFRLARLAVAEMVEEALRPRSPKRTNHRSLSRGKQRLNHSPSAPSLRAKPMLPKAAFVPEERRRKVSSPRSSPSERPQGPNVRTPSSAEVRLLARIQRVDQLTPRSQDGSRSLTPRRQDFQMPSADQEQLLPQERSPRARKKQAKTMGLDEEERAKCNGSLAAQATILLQRRREVATLRRYQATRVQSLPRQRSLRQQRSSVPKESRSLEETCPARKIAHEKVALKPAENGHKLAVDDVFLGCHGPFDTGEEVCLAGDDAKEDEDTDTVPMPGFTLEVSRLPPEATDASLRKMCQCFGVKVMRVRRPNTFEAEVLLGPLAEPERSRRTRLLASFLENRAGCQVSVRKTLA